MATMIFNETLEIDTELDEAAGYADTRHHDELDEVNDAFWVEIPECK